MNIFGKRLEEAMQNANMTQADLSRKTGLSEPTIYGYRKGNFKPKDKQLYLISVALDVSPSWLMGYDLPQNESSLDLALAMLWESLEENQKKQVLDYIRFLVANQTKST